MKKSTLASLIGTLAGTAMVSLFEFSDEINASPRRAASQVKDRTLFNHGKYVTTWYQNEVSEFDDNYIKFNGDPYQIYNNSTVCKSNGKSLEEIMARVGIYNKKNPNMQKETTQPAEGMQG